jgi:hypothetical protein
MKSQAILDAERDYQEAGRVAQEAIDAQTAAKKRLNLLEMEALHGIRIGDTLEWAVAERKTLRGSDPWNGIVGKIPAHTMKGLVVDNDYNWPVVQLYKKNGALGEKRQTIYFPRPSDSLVVITHATEGER